MAGSQQAIDFVWCEFCEHLQRCGRSQLQARLAALVRRDGADRELGGERVKVLTISSRQAATLLKCNDRSVRDAAATLAREEWFHVIEGARGKPPTYVLDELAARSAAPPDPLARLRIGEVRATQAAELVRGGAESVRASAGLCGPLRGGAGSTPCSEDKPNTNPVLKTQPSNHTHGHSAPPRTAPHHSAPLRSGPQPGERRLPSMPWRMGEVSDAELVAACRGGDCGLLRHLYEHALRLGWIADSADHWLRFLTACHHVATARVARRMGVLVMIVKQGLEVSRCRQASEDWAAALIRSEHKDPALVALGRSMPGNEEV
jgi:hypothetical protein